MNVASLKKLFHCFQTLTFKIVKLRVLSHVLVNFFWLTPRQVYKMSREDPEIGYVMGWPTTNKTRSGQ